MDHGKRIRSIETRLQQLRERVERTRSALETDTWSAITLVNIQAEKARDLANEALAEIRHLKEELGKLASVAESTPPLPSELDRSPGAG
ncbi:MAG: hypothetical protein ACXW31_08980 [Thermoanaerobaculia bacterium]